MAVTILTVLAVLAVLALLSGAVGWLSDNSPWRH